MIGIPGSGKTHFAQQWLAEHQQYIYISPDQIRAQLYGDPIIQGEWKVIQQRVKAEFEDAISQGRPVLYDATNIRRQWRQDFLRAFKPEGVHWMAWVFPTPVKVCIERNQQRERQVPIDVIIHYAQLLNQFPPAAAEGFIAVQEIPVQADGTIDLAQVNQYIQRSASKIRGKKSPPSSDGQFYCFW
ncbi:MAG: ATP-binding protein [Acaryochloridaceae cyanobacterium SU_2_1]|nr:ATP-binding protein [Acaryochloridaceae cyanobacterium SU_2_1]NJM95495.1 ATP-binding protein [Acaryochloridaceae cyanobacterium CSU_5_19]